MAGLELVALVLLPEMRKARLSGMPGLSALEDQSRVLFTSCRSCNGLAMVVACVVLWLSHGSLRGRCRSGGLLGRLPDLTVRRPGVGG